MTASEDINSKNKPIVEQALDLFVYAPVGLIMTSLEELRADRREELVLQGRDRLSRLMSNAKVVGQLTMTMSRRAVEAELHRWRPPINPPTDAHEPPDVGVASSEDIQIDEMTIPTRRNGDVVPELAIPGYEALSASQVVKRLDRLGPAELEAIYAYELATRRRRTILHRTQQLLGHEHLPTSASWPA